MIPRITPYNETQVKVEFPYEPGAVAQIKSEIPAPVANGTAKTSAGSSRTISPTTPWTSLPMCLGASSTCMMRSWRESGHETA
jgi:hypothetical protein